MSCPWLLWSHVNTTELLLKLVVYSYPCDSLGFIAVVIVVVWTSSSGYGLFFFLFRKNIALGGLEVKEAVVYLRDTDVVKSLNEN